MRIAETVSNVLFLDTNSRGRIERRYLRQRFGSFVAAYPSQPSCQVHGMPVGEGRPVFVSQTWDLERVAGDHFQAEPRFWP